MITKQQLHEDEWWVCVRASVEQIHHPNAYADVTPAFSQIRLFEANNGRNWVNTKYTQKYDDWVAEFQTRKEIQS